MAESHVHLNYIPNIVTKVFKAHDSCDTRVKHTQDGLKGIILQLIEILAYYDTLVYNEQTTHCTDFDRNILRHAA